MKTILNFFNGKKSFQPIFERIHSISLLGMNYGPPVRDHNRNGEAHVLEYVKKRFTNDHPIIFDVGANTGEYTRVLLATLGNLHPQVYCFEPSSKTFAKLQENLSQTANITLENSGFSNKATSSKLYSHEDLSRLASLSQRRLAHRQIIMDREEEVTLITIDAFCKEKGISKIDFLKFDIEGYEFKALEGAQEMLTNRKIQFIQFEFGGCHIDSRTYFQDFFYLLKDNYHLYRVVKDGLYPIRKYKENYEIFVTANYFAELKTA
jgi:FkbM family methyltransferase